MTLEQLMEKLSAQTPYQPMTQEEMEAAAQRRYQAVYDDKRLSAQRAYETEDAALERELAALQQSYDQQRAQTAAQTESTYRAADRHALSRGMQRSSYNESALANIRLAGDSALTGLSREQMQQEGEVQSRRTLLSSQLSQQLSSYDQQQRSDTLGYLDELAQREYERGVQSQSSANELAMKLYEYQHQLDQEAAEQARWQAEFNAKYGAKTRSSSGGSRKKTAAAAPSVSYSGGSRAGGTAQKMTER